MSVTNYIWDVENDSYLMETDETGNTTAEYTNEPGQYGPLLTQRRDGVTGTYHFDAQYSTRQLTDESEAATDTATYTVFGEQVARNGLTVNAFGYKGALGYLPNPSADDLYVRARTYEPKAARWLAVDPLIFVDGVNRYAYVANSPLTLGDPSGEKAWGTLKLAHWHHQPQSPIWDSHLDIKWAPPPVFARDPIRSGPILVPCCRQVTFYQIARTNGQPPPKRWQRVWHYDDTTKAELVNWVWFLKGNPAVRPGIPGVKPQVGNDYAGASLKDDPGPSLNISPSRVQWWRQEFETCAVCIGLNHDPRIGEVFGCSNVSVLITRSGKGRYTAIYTLAKPWNQARAYMNQIDDWQPGEPTKGIVADSFIGFFGIGLTAAGAEPSKDFLRLVGAKTNLGLYW